MEKAKRKKEASNDADKKSPGKKVAAKAHPAKQGYHGTNAEKNLNPEE